MERDARRTERFAVLHSRDAPAQADRELSRPSSPNWRHAAANCRWPNCAAATCLHPRCRPWCGANWCASTSARCVSPGRYRGCRRPARAQRIADSMRWPPSLSQLGGFHPFLLHGVTGSGKTAVYLAAMQRALDRGQSAILLVPEIGLTPQMVGLLDAAFGAARGAAALRAHARGTHRAVAAHPSRRGAHRGRHALGDLCAGAESRARSSSTKSTTRATSRKRRRATTRATSP